MVISAKNNCDTKTPKSYNKPHQKPFFSSEQREAFKNHEQICKLWRKEGRPLNKEHPIRLAKVESQRKLQRITRSEKLAKERKMPQSGVGSMQGKDTGNMPSASSMNKSLDPTPI